MTEPPHGPGRPPHGGPPPEPPRPPGPPFPYVEPAKRDGRPVSFYLAIFLALLLFVSGGLNVLLFLISAFGSAATGLGLEEADDMYQVVAVGGDPDAEARILRVRIEGAISEVASPLLGASGGVVSNVERALRYAARSDSVEGVLLEIDSPGGGVTDSDLIWQMVRDFREEHGKPVVALLGDLAASGGYYVAVACDRIIARPTTITGSIGVIMSSLNFAEAARELGIRQEIVVSENTPYKDMLSPFRPMTDAERQILGSIIEDMYQRFVGVVVEGRSELDRQRVIELADGRIYSADQALQAGLVDSIGGEESAVEVLEQLAEIDGARIVEYRRRPTFAELLLGVRTREPSLELTAARLLTTSTGPKLLYWWPGGR